MSELTDIKLSPLQKMKADVLRLLRTSQLDELKKKHLQRIFEYLPLEQLRQIYSGLQKEAQSRKKLRQQKFEKAKTEIIKIKKEAYQAAEKKQAKQGSQTTMQEAKARLRKDTLRQNISPK